MKKMIGLLLYGAVIFGVTAGVGMFMAKKQAAHTTAEGEEEHDEESTEEGHADESGHADSEHASAGPTPTASSLTGHGTPPKGHEDEHLPVAVRSSPMTVEEIVRMGLSLKSRDEAVRKREESLHEMETQQRLIMSDLAAAQQQVENLLAQTSDQRAAKEELLNRIIAQSEALELERKSVAEEQEKLKAEQQRIAQERTTWDSQKSSIEQRETDLTARIKVFEEDRKRFDEDKARVNQEMESLKKERENRTAEKESLKAERDSIKIDRDNLKQERDLFEQDKRAFVASTGMTPGAVGTPGSTVSTPPDAETRQKNIKQTAERVAAMTPESAADAIKSLASGGKEAEAVEILATLEPRKAGAIMDALQDDKLASQFIELMNNRNQQQKAAKKP